MKQDENDLIKAYNNTYKEQERKKYTFPTTKKNAGSNKKQAHGWRYYLKPLALIGKAIVYVVLFVLLFIWEMLKTYANTPSKKKKAYTSMTGWEFEEYCADILKSKGFKSVQVTKGSGDQGIDVLATKKGIRYAIQTKNYTRPVGNKAVQEAFSGCAYYDYDIPVVLTNATFTPSAKELARKTGVQLWNIDKT